jgi:hypothetical protein
MTGEILKFGIHVRAAGIVLSMPGCANQKGVWSTHPAYIADIEVPQSAVGGIEEAADVEVAVGTLQSGAAETVENLFELGLERPAERGELRGFVTRGFESSFK